MGYCILKLLKKLKSFDYLGTDFVKDLVDVCSKRSNSDKHHFIQQDMTDITSSSFEKI